MSRFDSIMKLLRVLAIGAVAVALFLLMERIPRIGENGLFSRRILRVEDTPLVLEKIIKIGELTTACYYDEDIYQTSKLTEITGPVGLIASAVGKNPSKDDLVIIARGTVRAGFDLSSVSSDSIEIRDDTLFLKLPRPRILSVAVNPSDYEIIGGNKSWSQKDVSSLVAEVRTRVLIDALDNDIYSRAESSGKAKVAQILEASGFRNISISISDK